MTTSTYRAGADLGGTKIQTVVVDSNDHVLGQARVPTPKGDGPGGVVAAIAGAVRRAAEDAGIEPAALSGIGVGSPGSVDTDAGTVSQAVNVVSDWTDAFPLGTKLGEELGAPVHLGNDVRVGTTAEMAFGSGQPYNSVIGVFWGTGVGGGVVLDKKIWIGRGAGGEIGHTVVRLGGARCTCGRKGCVEAYAGRMAMELEARRRVKDGQRTRLFDLMERQGRDRLTSGVWDRALEHRDRMAEELIDRALDALGAGIASVINLLDLEAVVIGGGLGTRLGQPYADRIAERMLPHLFVPERPPAVHVAMLGDLGGAIGAALLVKET
jgi:glucokinase